MRAPRRPRPTAAGGEPLPLADSLAELTRRLGTPPPPALAAVFGRWEDVVGPDVAAHARPLSLAGGVLVVAVDDPAWATQLRFLDADLRRRCEEVAGPGVVARVVVRVRR